MSYEYRAQMMSGTIKDAKDNYENAQGNAEKEKYEIEIQRLLSLQNAYKTAGEYEAKAKAFDRIAKIYTLFKEEYRVTIPTDDETLDFAIDISEIIDEYESGESNE